MAPGLLLLLLLAAHTLVCLSPLPVHGGPYELRGHLAWKNPPMRSHRGDKPCGSHTGAGNHPRTGYKLDCLLAAGQAPGCERTLAPIDCIAWAYRSQARTRKKPGKNLHQGPKMRARRSLVKEILSKILIL